MTLYPIKPPYVDASSAGLEKRSSGSEQPLSNLREAMEQPVPAPLSGDEEAHGYSALLPLSALLRLSALPISTWCMASARRTLRVTARAESVAPAIAWIRP